jgi:hypothetical protein
MANPVLLTFTIPYIDIDKKTGKKNPRFTIKWKQEINKIIKDQEKYNLPLHDVNCVLTGKINGISVLDFDSLECYEKFKNDYPELINTYRVKTRSGGYHLYYNYNPLFQTQGGNDKMLIDIRTDGGLVFGAGSKCKDGSKYVLDNDVEYLDLPDNIYEDIKFKSVNEKKIVNKKIQDVAIKYPENTENTIIFEEEKPELIEDEEEENILYEIIDNISTYYIEDYNSWWRIVVAMFNSKIPIEFAKKISKKTKNYNDNSFNNVWKNAKKYTKLTRGTLNHYSRLSNQEVYFNILAKEKKNFIGYGTEMDIARLLLELVGDDLIYSKEKLYYYFKGSWLVGGNIDNLIKKQLYDLIMKFLKLVLQPIKKEVSDKNKLLEEEEEKQTKDNDKIKQLKEEIKALEEEIGNIQKIIYQLGKVSFQNNVLTQIKVILSPNLDDIDFDVNEEQMFNLHFKNGVYELNNKKFRLRRKDDHVSKILDWNLLPRNEIPQNIFDDVLDFFCKVQPNASDRKFMIDWLAYCLDGKNQKQKMKMNIGYTAENGKSTEFNIHGKVFDIYTTKLDAETFNLNYPKRHKQIRELLECPIRTAYIEEMKDEKLDGNFLKEFIDGTKINCEVLFGTKIVKSIQAKLSTCGNKDFNLTSCKGIERRGLVQHYQSQFKKKDEEVNPAKNVFKRVDNFENRFDDELYKNAYLHILLDHYNHLEFDIPDKFSNNFKNIIDDYNELETCIMYKYKVSEDPEDKLYKQDLVDYVNKTLYNGKNVMTSHKLIKEIKKFGIGYESRKRITGSNKQGIFTFIKVKEDYVEIDE